MATLNCEIPSSLLKTLQARATTGESVSHAVTAALSQYLHLRQPVHTMFQVSTSGALVAGVYAGTVTAATLLKHGDFGLGTFEGLDGEMVVLDGHVYRVRATGQVSEASGDAQVPFAVVTNFAPAVDVELPPAASLEELSAQCDAHRPSNNVFYAFRIDGLFPRVRTRAIGAPPDDGHLVDAAKAQAEFTFKDSQGTLVGLWSPGFSSAFSIAGYHFHFLSNDRTQGGHLLACATGAVRMRMEAVNDFHLALPEQEDFLKADLSRNTERELAYVEKARPH